MRQKTAQHYARKIQKYRKYNHCRIKRQQKGGFLNRYDFAYTGRDTINQAFKNLNKTAPKLISQTSKEVDKIVEARKRQLINDGGQQIQKNCTKNHTWSYGGHIQNTIQIAREIWETKIL